MRQEDMEELIAEIKANLDEELYKDDDFSYPDFDDVEDHRLIHRNDDDFDEEDEDDICDNEDYEDDYYDDDYGTHYGKYAGSYAQDVEGYDDETIDEVFDGDPEAYWNID